MLVLFLIFHLSMNSLLYFGANLFNFFPVKAHQNPVFLKLAELGLASVFFIHIGFTISLVIQNRKARGHSYEIEKPKGKRSLATRLMPYSATVLLLFLIFHLFDFTFAYNCLVPENPYGLWGVVVEAFKNPLRVLGYVVAMFAVGFHLAHGIQSTFQSFGYYHPKVTPCIQKISTVLGVLIAVGFSIIPIYTFICLGE
jgi:succinate dehydrogenase / fumarate reductase cytochrome b subunit